MFAVNATSGALTQLSSSPLPFSGTPNSIVVDKSSQFAYVSTFNQISGFAISPTDGSLTQLPDSPYSATASKLVVDPSGQFIYGTGQEISSFAMNRATGTLTAVGEFPARNPQTLAITAGSAGITYTPDFAYVT